jgi:hypothetical protein
MHRVITIRKIPQEVIAILVTGFGAGGLAKLLAIAAGRPGPEGLGALAGTLIYSAVVGPFLFMLLDWIMRIKSRPGYGPGLRRDERRGLG